MKEFKGTPGPWVWHTGHNDSCWLGQICASRHDGAVIDDGSAYGEYCAVIDASGYNAMLIAAAPELLELVISANLGATGSHTVAWQERAQAAIKKALGESQ